MAVSPDRHNLHPKMNIDRVGFYKRAEINERASGSAYLWGDLTLDTSKRRKIMSIHMEPKWHTHEHPYNKVYGKGWVVSSTSWGNYDSPLMFWNTATHDSTAHFSNAKFYTPTLASAVEYCEAMGLGYEIEYPKTRWHTRKSYSDNFQWKGKAEEDEPYD